MGYFVDLTSISLAKYKRRLKKADLLPSRRILKENIEKNFKGIKAEGIKTVEDLFESLKTRKKLQDFARQSGIDEDYLTILIREVKSYKQKPCKLVDFPGIQKRVVSRLEKIGIKDSKGLYDRILVKRDRKLLAKETGILLVTIEKLSSLSDLCRIRWVNHTFSNVLYEANFLTAKQVAEADHEVLYQQIKEINQKKKLYKGQVGIHDMKLLVEAAKELEFELKL